MNKTKTIALLGAILAMAVVAGATAAVLAPTQAFASSHNNQQNSQGAFNFNNQQFKSNFECFGCNP